MEIRSLSKRFLPVRFDIDLAKNSSKPAPFIKNNVDLIGWDVFGKLT